jgi:hypothetical protein
MSLKRFLFYQDNCQEFLVLQVNPKIYQDNKSLLKHRKAIDSWAPVVLLHWYEGWDRFTYVKERKEKQENSKRHITLEVKASSFYWSQQSREVNPTSYTCQAEGIFGLGWLDWACYFRGAPLTTGWWDPTVCHQPSVNVNSLGCDALTTSEPWSLAIRFPNST